MFHMWWFLFATETSHIYRCRLCLLSHYYVPGTEPNTRDTLVSTCPPPPASLGHLEGRDWKTDKCNPMVDNDWDVERMARTHRGTLNVELGEVREVSRRSWYPNQDLKDERVGWERGRVAWFWGEFWVVVIACAKAVLCEENMILCRNCPV